MTLTFARMPLEKLLAAKVLEASDGRIALHMEACNPAFPDRVVLRGVRFRVAAGKTDLRGLLDLLQVRPDYSGLLRGYLPIRFQGKSPGGAVQGRIGMSPGNGLRDGYLQLHTEEFALERFPAIGAFLDRKLEGRMSAELDLRGNLEAPAGAEGKGSLQIDNGALEANLGLPGLEEIPFESLVMSFTLEKGTLDVSRAEMKGPAFSGHFQGDLVLREALPRSRLRLQGELTPGPMVLENAFLSRFLQKVLKGDQSVRVRVRGTLQSPSIARIKG
ncbi:MAG: type II secretion system protein GspN [Deltaproteobacteria bacterium]|nr:type II secretion system protein GspN [Deltaproteobacteria bacterium]